MAVDIVDKILDVTEANETVYIYHEIVHNKHVVDRLRKRGARFVERIEEIPKGSIVVFSAHGVSPSIRKEAEKRNLTCIDATCPLVTKVHAEAIRYAKRGWQILLIGHKNHQEVVGTQGEAPESIQIVETIDDIPNLEIIDPEKLAYVTQTTLSTDDAEKIIAALKEAFPKIHSPPTEDICYATTKRQKAVRNDAVDTDLVLVIGSQNSSNSLRLTEIAETSGTKAYLLDDVSKLNPDWLQNVNSVLITAGASAPEHLVLDLIQHLSDNYCGKLEGESKFDEGMTFSMPISLTTFLLEKDVTIEGQNV
jgi:4-hydroxy-3-methylbut-2-enyl diphosphate reductase